VVDTVASGTTESLEEPGESVHLVRIARIIQEWARIASFWRWNDRYWDFLLRAVDQELLRSVPESQWVRRTWVVRGRPLRSPPLEELRRRERVLELLAERSWPAECMWAGCPIWAPPRTPCCRNRFASRMWKTHWRPLMAGRWRRRPPGSAANRCQLLEVVPTGDWRFDRLLLDMDSILQRQLNLRCWYSS